MIAEVVQPPVDLAPPVSVPAVAARPCFDLEFRQAGGRSFVAAQYVRYPVHVGRGLYIDDSMPALCTLYLQSVSGGLFESETVAGRIVAAAGTAAHVATPAATIVHAMRGGQQAAQSISLEAGSDSLLEYMPAPLILFPESRLRSETAVKLAAGATAVVCETFLMHDYSGAQAAFGEFDSKMDVVDDDGRLLVRERMRVTGDAWRDGSSGVTAGCRVHGSLWVLRRADAAGLLAALQAAPIPVDAYAGASALPNEAGAVFRVLGLDAISVDQAIHRAWSHVRRFLTGSEPAPRRR